LHRASALLLLLLTTLVGAVTASAHQQARATSPAQTTAPLTVPRGSVTARPFVVMLDNHPDAYPQTGMNQAPIVFEALAEYGITRYMAVFVPGVSPALQTIGPVRSARAYFVEYAKGLRGIYVHAGGSPEGLLLAETSVEIQNMDALRKNASAYFRRAKERAAPHNLYTSSAELAAFAAAQKGPAPDLREIGFLYKEEAPVVQRPAAQSLSYFFIYRESYVAWSYDRASNSYLYFRQKRPHVDAATGQQLRFKNVVVLEVPERPIPGDPKKRIEQEVVGEGAARVFIDGTVVEGTWRKGAGFAQLQLYGRDGAELALNPGPVWIAAIPSLKNLTVKGGP
jgi:hypothetical protein